MVGTKIYVVGGHNGDDYLGSIEFLDVRSEAKVWSKITIPSFTKRRCPLVSPLRDDDATILISGGYDGAWKKDAVYV